MVESLTPEKCVPQSVPFNHAGSHWFVHQDGHECNGIGVSVCADGAGRLAFSVPTTACDGDPTDIPAEHRICLQLTGDAEGSGVNTPGELDAGLDHFADKSCNWTNSLGGTCAVVWPTPGSGAHYHWHEKTSSWQSHGGSATTSSTLLGGPTVCAPFMTSYKYATTVTPLPGAPTC